VEAHAWELDVSAWAAVAFRLPTAAGWTHSPLYFWSQGCSGVELQRLLSASGFRLFLTAHALDTTRCSPPPASLLGRVSPFRRHRALSPDVLHGRPHLPYNLYAIHCKEGADA
jgi:hypothetical protein